MGKQILIIGITGTFNPALLASLTSSLTAQKVEIRHAAHLYDGQAHQCIGTADDLAADLSGLGHRMTLVSATSDAAAKQPNSPISSGPEKKKGGGGAKKEQTAPPLATEPATSDDQGKEPTESPPAGEQSQPQEETAAE